MSHFGRAFALLTLLMPLSAVGSGVAIDTKSASEQECNRDTHYCPSADQERVDRSFSLFRVDQTVATLVDSRAIITPAAIALGGLTEIPENDCARWGECDFRDANGVRHYLWGEPANLYVVVKIVHADEFIDRPIGAIGIGLARDKDNVLGNVRQFLPNVEIECNNERLEARAQPFLCHFSLDPGWVRIEFDSSGRLTKVKLDGFHFT